MTSPQVQQIPLDKIVVHDQVRDRYDDRNVISMALSMKAVGLLYAILLRQVDGAFVVVDGGTRYWAAKKLGWKSIAAAIIDDGDLREGGVVHRQLIANTTRTALQPLETARGIAHLMELTGWNASEAASQLGMSNGTVARYLALRSLPAAITQQIDAKVIPMSTGYEISKISDPDKQAEMAREAADGRLTRDAASGMTKRKKSGDASPEKVSPQPKRVTALLVGGQSVTVASENLTLERFIEVLQILLTQARKARTQGLELKPFIGSLKQAAGN